MDKFEKSGATKIVKGDVEKVWRPVKSKTPQVERVILPLEGAHYSEYKDHHIIEFIQSIEKHQIAWDSSLDNSHRKEVSVKIYNNIEQKMKWMRTGKNYHGAVAKKLWELLKRDYESDQLKIQKAPSGSGVSKKPLFPYSEYMRFLDGAKHKRAVQNGFVLGSEDVTVKESISVEAEESDKNVEIIERAEQKENPSELKMTDLKLSTPKTPKRRLPFSVTETPKRRRKDDDLKELFKKLEESNQEIVNAVKESTGGETSGNRLSTVFQVHTENWPQIERDVAEAKVMLYIRNLKIPGPETLPSNFNFHPYNQAPSTSAHSTSVEVPSHSFDYSMSYPDFDNFL
ncbi:unnamed protein product [Caenorhabditis nigoni]